MAQVKLNSKSVIHHLATLSQLLAEAIDWVNHQNRKIVLGLPDECAPNMSGESCVRPLPPRGRTEAQILIAVLKRMHGKRQTKRSR